MNESQGNNDVYRQRLYFVTKKYLVLKINRTLKRVNRAEARGKYFLLFCLLIKAAKR